MTYNTNCQSLTGWPCHLDVWPSYKSISSWTFVQSLLKFQWENYIKVIRILKTLMEQMEWTDGMDGWNGQTERWTGRTAWQMDGHWMQKWSPCQLQVPFIQWPQQKFCNLIMNLKKKIIKNFSKMFKHDCRPINASLGLLVSITSHRPGPHHTTLWSIWPAH